MLCSDGNVKLLDFGAARKPSEETSDEKGAPLIARAENLGISPAFDCTECSVILPKNIVGKICGGLNFTGDNMIIKSVVIFSVCLTLPEGLRCM